MNDQQHIAGKGNSNTPKTFKYVLSSSHPLGVLELKHVPQGWEGAELTFIRDPKYKGVLTTFSTSELTFIKEGRNYIQTVYENGGIDFDITVRIFLYSDSEMKYNSYFTGKIDLSTYDINDIGVSCEIIPTGFQNSILNRADMKVDLLNTKFIGGGEGSMAQLANVPQTLQFGAYVVSQDADWFIQGEEEDVATIFQHYLPMQVNSTDFAAGSAQAQTFGGTAPFFTSDDVRDINLKGSIQVEIVDNAASDPINIDINIKLYKNEIVLQTYVDSDVGITALFQFDVDEDISLIDTDELSFRGTVTHNGEEVSVGYFNDSVTISEDIGASLEGVAVESFPIFEYTARILQLTSGEVDPLDSTLLGRVDSLPVSYPEKGDGAFVIMTKGQWIRQFPLEEGGTIIQTLNGSLNDIFKDINARENAGLGFEDRSGTEKVIIEKEAYFFDIEDNPNFPATDDRPYVTNQILDLSDVVTDEKISKQVLPEWYANEIESGYSDFEYEFIQGLKEFNTKSSYATPIKSVKNKLDLTSPIRYDTQGANKLRAKPYDGFATEDVNGDNDVFGFDSKKLGVFVVKTNEDFSLVTGGIDPEQSYNLKYTPRRNGERHGNRYKSMRLAVTDEIQFLKTDKNNRLITQLSTESDPKAENGDLLVDDLTDGYWLPESYTFEAPVNETVIAAIQDNPYGVIKIANDKFGWILEVQTNSENNKGQFKLLRVNTAWAKATVQVDNWILKTGFWNYDGEWENDGIWNY